MVRTVHPRTTGFTCSDDLQNWIYDRVKWTFDNLSIGGYIVDCPQRERLGYGDAAYISCETGMFNYALGSLYTKWMQDWRDVQGRQSNMKPRIGGGILPHSAPTYDGGGGPGWGSCTVIVPWLVYCHYTDTRILEDNFGMISAWLDFLDSHTENGILKVGRVTDFQAHQMEHQLGAYTDCNHGQGMAVLQPVYYRHIFEDGIGKFVRFAERVWGISPEGKKREELAEAGIDALVEFIREVGLPTSLRELGIKNDKKLKDIAESCHYSPGGYRKLEKDEVLEIFRECY